MNTIFFDIDTQIDFLYPAGALYVPDAEVLLPVIAKLNHAAPLVISTMCTHAEDDPEFRMYPHHCVTGTFGRNKPAATLLEGREVLSARLTGTTPAALNGTRQLILEKQKLDLFTNPYLAPLLRELNAERYVVYGVVTEICVRCAVFGLLKSGRQVDVVTDAIRGLNDVDAENTLGGFTAAGARLITSGEV